MNYTGVEEKFLAPYAMKPSLSRGREFREAEHPFRSPYQRDRDRVIHSTAFRRLEYKTQVFIIHEGDYYRTRLTHTIEVAQIARTIARALKLNEDLTEAISLAHDLGHTAFGHSGETALKDLMKDYGGYEHNRQSLRVVEKLEKRYPDFDGLNLTYEVREGIIKHISEYDTPPEAKKFFPEESPTLEAQIVNLADEIAYSSHDVDDGLKAGLITAAELSRVEIWKKLYTKAEKEISRDPELVWYKTVRNLIDLLATDLINETRRRIAEFKIRDLADVRKNPILVKFSDGTAKGHKELKGFLLENMYHHYRVVRMSEKAKRTIEAIFKIYLKQPKQMPPGIYAKIEQGETTAQAVCDYVAGMTDDFAQQEHKKLFDPYTRV
ncbi:MAG: deoxyguanosinetriphosphate triphosphohydrolase [Candidatus Ratteibacteria bacterium]|jgi:dGTPase